MIEIILFISMTGTIITSYYLYKIKQIEIKTDYKRLINICKDEIINNSLESKLTSEEKEELITYIHTKMNKNSKNKQLIKILNHIK